jgi:hypothetical protein
MTRWRSIAAIASIVGWTGAAAAQLPVCPQPEPDQSVYTACLPGGRFLVAPLLANLAVDQLLRPEPGPITREPRAVFASLATAETLENNAALADYLGRLAPLKLTRIDTSTGTLRMDVGEDQRSFSTSVAANETAYRVGLELPERIEGGYWRTPGVVQMAFWKGQRARFTVAAPDGPAIAAEVECLVVSSDGIRLVTTGSQTPDILVRFESCP